MTGFFEANLNALTRRDDPDAGILFRDLTARGPGPDLGLRDRTGKVLPGLVHAGRPRSRVSTFDPAKEADRWVSAASEAGTAAVFRSAQQPMELRPPTPRVGKLTSINVLRRHTLSTMACYADCQRANGLLSPALSSRGGEGDGSVA